MMRTLARAGASGGAGPGAASRGSVGIGWFTIFFLKDTAPTEIYTLSLHDALPICVGAPLEVTVVAPHARLPERVPPDRSAAADRKSTRLNSSHVRISYAVFCL